MFPVWNTDSTGDVFVTEINDDVVLGFQNTESNLYAEFDEDSIADGAIDVALIDAGEMPEDDAATELNVNGAVTLVVDAGDNDVDTVNVVATGAASRLVLDFDEDTAEEITTLNVTGAAAGSAASDGDVYINAGNVAETLTEVTSTSTADVTLVIAGNGEDLSVTTAGGDDRLVLSAGTFNARDSIDLGAGEDALELHFGAGDINLIGKSTIVAGVNAADGVETLIVDAWNSDGAINRTPRKTGSV